MGKNGVERVAPGHYNKQCTARVHGPERLSQLKKGRATKNNISEDTVHAQWLSQVPEGRLAQPEETADAIGFLVSPAAAYIRGLSLPVDGGRLKGI